MAIIKEITQTTGFTIDINMEEAEQFFAWYQLKEWGSSPILQGGFPPFLNELSKMIYRKEHG